MYSATSIEINKILTREEIIKEILKKNESSACRFIVTGFKLTDEEIEMFRRRYRNEAVNRYLDYYMLGDTEAFSLKRNKSKILKR